jgi:hypothetical protein
MADCGTCKRRVSNATQPYSAHAVIPAGSWALASCNGLRMVIPVRVAELFDGPSA